MTSRDRSSGRSTSQVPENLEVGWSRLPQLRELLTEVARTPGARVSVIQLDADTTERVIARRDADVPPKVLYRWALALFRDHAPPGAARFRVRTWTPEGRPIRGVVCGRGYDGPAPNTTVTPPALAPASDPERRRTLARAEAAEARVAALEAQLAARRAAPAPPPDPSPAAHQHRLAEQEARIKALERERAKFKDLADEEKARADDWKDRALALAVKVGRFAQEAGEE